MSAKFSHLTKKGLTVLEIIIASMMLVIILSALFSLNITNNEVYLSMSGEVKLLQESSGAFFNIQQRIRRGFDVSVNNTANTIRIAMDSAGTVWSKYSWEDSPSDPDNMPDEIRYYPDEAQGTIYTVIAVQVTDFAISFPIDDADSNGIDDDGKAPYFSVFIRTQGVWPGNITKTVNVREKIGARPFQGIGVGVS